MLVSKIKPCTSKYKPAHGETANGSLNRLRLHWCQTSRWITCGNSGANTCNMLRPGSRRGRAHLLGENQCLRALADDTRVIAADRTASRRRRIFRVSDLSR